MTKRILIVSRTMPVFEGMGGAAHMYDMVECLKEKGFEIGYLYLGTGEQISDKLQKIARIYGVSTPASFPANGWPTFYDAEASQNEKALFSHVYPLCQPDIVIADYQWLNGIFDLIPADHKTERVTFVHEVRMRMIQSFDSIGMQSAYSDWNETKETALLKKANTLLVLQNEDEEGCRKMVPDANIIRIGISDRIIACDPAKEIPGCCMYIASNVAENYHAGKWLLDKVWPLVLQNVPGASLIICGSICNRLSAYKDISGVILAGWVENLHDISASAQVAVIPHFMHGGTKLKFIRALSYGRPVVANSCGIDGFPEAKGTCALIADDPEQFAAHMVEIIKNDEKRHAMQEAAMALAQERLSPQAAYGKLFTYLEKPTW